MAKPKILLLGDDFRLPSGIGTISKEIILNTVHKYDWIQIGAAMQHEQAGQLVDMSQDIANETGITDANVKVIPYNGYGDRNILFNVISNEKPDAILHFTDPRYWVWFYQLEHEIKTRWNIPIMYYSIWDDLPYPMWNAPYYGSSDLIMGISSQSDNIHREVLKQNGYGVYNFDAINTFRSDLIEKHEWNDVITSYVPHGLNHRIYDILPKEDPRLIEMTKMIKERNDVDFVVMWSNRNIRRKHPGDVILAFKEFRNRLPEDKQDRVALLMHSAIVDANGTDLRAVWKALAPECKLIFSDQKISAYDLNAMYNVADVVVNMASNEGWGLSQTEAMLTGTPTIVNVTGGLQDQCGFKDDEGNWLKMSVETPSNHRGIYREHGEWVIPVFPSNISLQGSPQTPYIYDDRPDVKGFADALWEWWVLNQQHPELFESKGASGRTFALENGLTAEAMASKMETLFDYMLSGVKETRPPYTFNKVELEVKYENIGTTL